MTGARLAPTGAGSLNQGVGGQFDLQNCPVLTVCSAFDMDSSTVQNAATTLLILASDRSVIDESHGGISKNGSKMSGGGISKQQSEMRKANKPLMEKRRRARINKSLNELKSILIESMERNSPGHSKWEKADILEMTVQYLHCLRNQRKASRSDPLAVGQFIAGYSECVRQVQKFAFSKIPSSPQTPIKGEIREKLTEHLLSYLKTFSDDATRALQSQSIGNRCPSPPMGSDASRIGSTDESPPSRHSALSSFASPSPRSPSRDSMISDGFSSDDGSRRDLNNNNASGIFLSESDVSPGGSVWRPW